MKFQPLQLMGAFVIEPDLITDERGFFTRSFCRKEFVDHGLNINWVQCNISFNILKGTLRGMHYQKKPYQETKLVRCTKGSIYDVIIDLRENSPTFSQWAGIELNADNHKAIYIPEGFAHGFLTLSEDSEVYYQMSEFFHPECTAGLRWDDPAFAINWVSDICSMSERDRRYPDFFKWLSMS